MNWDKVLPWRSDDAKDSTYEEQVKDRCEHSPVESVDKTWLGNPRVEEDYVVFDQKRSYEGYCEDCGQYLYSGNTEVKQKVAVPVSFYIEKNVSLEEALDDPDEQETGRIVVNESEQ